MKVIKKFYEVVILWSNILDKVGISYETKKSYKHVINKTVDNVHNLTMKF